jgi:hypothetical protein
MLSPKLRETPFPPLAPVKCILCSCLAESSMLRYHSRNFTNGFAMRCEGIEFQWPRR